MNTSLRNVLFAALICAVSLAADAVSAQDRGSRGGFGGGPPGGFGGRGSFGGPPGGFGGSSSRGSFMDRNGDGRIDQSEIDQMPSQFRQMMESRGIRLRAGLSVDDFRNSIREGFTRSREEGDSRSSRSDGRSDRSRDDSRRSSRSSSSGPEPFIQQKREPITVNLSERYAEYDADYDNQIGFYEWILSSRERIEEFELIDTNFDGMLTALELNEWDAAGQETENSGSLLTNFKRPKLLIVDGTGVSGSDDPNDKRSKEEKEQVRQQAERYFGMLDRDRDGKISEEEWSRSRRVRGMFEQADIKLADMDLKTFQNSYLRTTANQDSGGDDGGDRRGGWGGGPPPGWGGGPPPNWGGGPPGGFGGRDFGRGDDRGGDRGGDRRSRGDRGDRG